MIDFDQNKLTIDGRSFELEYGIDDAVKFQDIVIVLFDPDAYTAKFGQFPNLTGLSHEGRKLWAAELPTTTSGDRYYRLIHSCYELRAASVYSFVCEIDSGSGKIVRKEFIK